MLPYEVKLTLQVLDIGSDGYHGILVWNDDDILSSGSVCTEATRTATPHLIAIALHPVAGLLSHASLRSLLDTSSRIDALYLFL